MNAREVTDKSFTQEVLQAPGLVMVDFWAPWCGPCRALAPVVEQIAGEVQGRATVVKVNVEENPSFANRYQVQGIPALLFFRAGQLVARMVGAQPRQAILAQINALTADSRSDTGAGATRTSAGASGNGSAAPVVACPACGQKNRVPADGSGQPVCGRCHAPLPSAAGAR